MLGISEITAGANFAVSHWVHSRFSLVFGSVSERFFVRWVCCSAIFRSVEGVIVWAQCLQSMQMTMGLRQPITSISYRLFSCLKRMLLWTL